MMTEKELNEKVTVQWTSKYGCYKIEIMYYGKVYDCLTLNTMAVDVIKNGSRTHKYRTRKQALQALYDEVKSTYELK